MVIQRLPECRGCELDSGVWYCASHGVLYMCVPKMHGTFIPSLRGKPMLIMQHWLDRMEWPLTTLPINGCVYIPVRVVLPQESDFGSVSDMFRWMDHNGIERNGGK